MSLTPGTRIGAYEVLAPLGRGGMGEVYRARDAKLGRDVAMKVLPAAWLADPDRRGRFDREARTLASLNHPHIGAIYGFEDSGDVRALVLELVEGPTLAERIARGPLPVRETMEIAAQIADALDAAHERGIVHRDLKPANVKVTPDGRVKVLDFGLAKLAVEDGAPELSQSPTMTVAHTAGGVLLGTAAYMSPEQARGLVVDKRADIWAFGCVLYEMLTGRAAFARATPTDTLAAIVEGQPDSTLLPAATSPSVRRLLRRCLDKDPKARLRDIGDARVELADTAADAEAIPVTVPRSSTRPAAFVVAALAAASIAGLTVTMLNRKEVQPARSEIGELTRVTADPGLTTEPSVSQDGRLIAYASNRGTEGQLDIWVQQTSGGRAIRLTTDEADDRQPDISPDGSLIAFRSDRKPAGVYVMPALGGDARLIATDGRGPRFSHDGRFIAFWTGRTLAARALNAVRKVFIVPVGGGEPVQLGADVAAAGDPIWSPDDRHLLVFGRRTTTSPGGDDWWWLSRDPKGQAADTGVFARLKRRGILLSDTDALPFPQAWSRDGVVFAASMTGDARHIWSIGIDQGTGRAVADPVRLTSGTTWDDWPSSSRDGRLVFTALTTRRAIFGVPLDADAGRPIGAIRGVREEATETGRPSASQDGRLLAFPRYEFNEGGVWLRELDTGRERQLAVTPRTPLNPVMSFDGTAVAYTVTAVETGGNGGGGAGYVLAVSGGSPRKVCDDCEIWHWANRTHVLATNRAGALSVIDVATGRATIVIESGGIRAVLSPNQRWLSLRSGQQAVLAPFFMDRASSASEWIKVFPLIEQERPTGWSPDGRLLYLLLDRDGFRCLYALRVDPATGRPSGDPFAVYHFHDQSRRWGSTGYGSAVVRGWFFADLTEQRGNVWMTTLGAEGR